MDSTISNMQFSQDIQGNTFDIMQQNNRMLVLRLIKDAGKISRKSLSQLTKLNSSTITIIINELMEKGLVCESGLMEGENGRRVTGLTLNPHLFSCITITITTDYFSVSLYDINSHCLEAEKITMSVFNDITFSLVQIKEKVNSFIKKSSSYHLKVAGLAFALQGPFQFAPNECIMQSSSGYYVDIVRYFENAFHHPIIYDTTSNYAIYRYTCTKEYNYLQNQLAVYIGINYSVDMSVTFNRTLLKGLSFIPGSLGQLPVVNTNGREVPLASIISASEIVDRVKNMILYHPESVLFDKPSYHIRDIINAFYDGDPVALQIYSEVAIAIGRMIKTLIYILHPNRILLAGEIPNNETFQQMIINASVIYPSENSCNITTTMPQINVIQEERKTSNDPSMIGASMKVFNRILKSPELFSS
ncbi:hypothetical protein CBFG_03554 [Clostridiales bacterium 1_7_47FAA]|uniref:ROK family transcriptional regulator n=1 Tax=Enterocloster hominis (ex Hitch et al. 2024) TaxID=1917870 RepID=A0ABV1DBT4_9FIRM|nr:hypothetical protein CBFG_03554 [Clostridiales bacterium 1_7_47FAA]